MATHKCWWASCALSLLACGRIAPGTDDVAGSNDAQLDCTYGKIASVPGLPLALASTGKSIFIVSYDVGGVIGDLRAIGSDGAVHLLVSDNAAVGMITSGTSVVFTRRSFDQQQNLLGETIDVVDENLAISQLDTTTDTIAQVDSLIGDGRGNAYWQRWDKGTLPDEPSLLGSVSLEKYAGGSVVTVAGNSGTSWATDIVTDGTDYYGLVPPTDPNLYNPDLGRVAINATPELVLVSDTADGYDEYFQGVIGVDGDEVVYLTSGEDSLDAWTVPKNGGSPVKLVENQTMLSSPVLYDHHFYWVQQNADGTNTVSRVATSGGSVEKLATENATIGGVAVDACGVSYAVTDSYAPGTTGSSIYRVKM